MTVVDAPALAAAASSQDEPQRPPMMKFKLKSNDDQIIEVDEDVAFQSHLLKKMVSDLGITEPSDERLDEPLPVSNLDGWTLKKIVEWCTMHRGEVYKCKEDHEDPRINLTQEDERYMDVSSDQLLAMLLGANYLDIPGVLDIITQKIANMAIGKSVEEIREVYGLANDFTAEEEEELRKRFEWVEA